MVTELVTRLVRSNPPHDARAGPSATSSVGSGAGGGVVAAELAQAGLSVVVLEEGAHHATESFTTSTTRALRTLYRDGGATATLGRAPVGYAEGRCVGGGTVVNGGMSFRASESVLSRWAASCGTRPSRATASTTTTPGSSVSCRWTTRCRIGRTRPGPVASRRSAAGLAGHREPAQPPPLRRLQRLHVGVPHRRQAVDPGQLPAACVEVRGEGVVRLSGRACPDERQAGNRGSRARRRRLWACEGFRGEGATGRRLRGRDPDPCPAAALRGAVPVGVSSGATWPSTRAPA